MPLGDLRPCAGSQHGPCAKHQQAESCSQSPEASPSCAARRDQTFSPGAVAGGAEAEPAACAPEALTRASQPGLLLSPSLGSSALAWLVRLVVNAGWLGEPSEA